MGLDRGDVAKQCPLVHCFLVERFLLGALDSGAQSLEVLDEIGITAVDVEDIVHRSCLISAQSGQYKTRSSANIGTPHMGRRQALLTTDHHMVAVDLCIRTKTQHLIDEPKARLKDILRDDGSTLRDRGQTNGYGLKIRGESWIRQRLIVHGRRPTIHAHAEAIDVGVNISAG